MKRVFGWTYFVIVVCLLTIVPIGLLVRNARSGPSWRPTSSAGGSLTVTYDTGHGMGSDGKMHIGTLHFRSGGKFRIRFELANYPDNCHQESPWFTSSRFLWRNSLHVPIYVDARRDEYSLIGAENGIIMSMRDFDLDTTGVAPPTFRSGSERTLGIENTEDEILSFIPPEHADSWPPWNREDAKSNSGVYAYVLSAEDDPTTRLIFRWEQGHGNEPH